MLLEVFACKHPVDLIPQKGNGKLGLADIQTNVELTKPNLVSKLTQEKFTELNLAEEEILAVPVLAKMHCVDWFDSEPFLTAIFNTFLDAFIEEIN